VRCQLPLAIGEDSRPEPDVSVMEGDPRIGWGAVPTRAALVVEVAESSLEFDRNHKGSLHARAGLPAYWILNLPDRVLEVHRRPGPDPRALFGWRYTAVEVLSPGDRATPLAAGGGSVAVADLLP
jgi:Uma2 family endonuclease